MPKGTVHRETGILRRASVGYALEMDGGGRWQLDIKGSARKLLGKRVTVEGRRMGFDLIFVDRIWTDGENYALNFWSKISIVLGAARK